MHVELGDLATGEMTAGGKTTLPSLQTVIEGSWNMSFPLNYEDASIELSAGQRTKLDGIDVANRLRSPLPHRHRSRIHSRRATHDER